ncbi:hypothetical protein [Psychrobacillus sp. FSL H8-0487]|uniref:hypothetical protein n=1 Tax=Psychrobacillus sp. FSL H8-0487 TaxID=2921391 RepID=UPI0030F96990
MTVKKHVNARITLDLLNDYVEEFKKYENKAFPDARPSKELTITQILEESLFYATKYLEEKNTLEK